LLAQGLTADQIAAKLQLARSTVVRYLRALRVKSDSDSLEALTAWARTRFPAVPPSKRAKPRPERTRKPPRRTAAASSGPLPRSRPRAGPQAARPVGLPSPPPPTASLAAPGAQAPQSVPDLTSDRPEDLSTPAPSGWMSTPDLPPTSELGGPGLLDHLRHRTLLLMLAEVKRLVGEGEAHLKAGRDDEALAAFDLALAKEPDNVPALAGRGEVHRRMRRFDRALEDLNRALQLQPSNTRVLQIRSETNRDAGRKARAFVDRLRTSWHRQQSKS
jgi:tetratricopeptide (TPR) repeat protein